MKKPTRVRRTPKEARDLILSSAAKRLEQAGIKGLNIKDVAAESGINHGTILHHFGSADEMRASLLARMTTGLIQEMSEELKKSTDDQVINRLFRLMGKPEHIKLLAWRVMENETTVDLSEQARLMEEILSGIRTELAQDEATVRNLVALVVSTAIGWSMCRDGFTTLLGMTEDEQNNFPGWVASQVLGPE